MAHTAIAMARHGGAWSGEERWLTEVEDLDSLTDELRDITGDLVVLFIEEDDEWLGIVHIVGDQDPQIFLSDRRSLATSDLADRLFSDALPVLPPQDSEEDTPRAEAEPVGDTDLLTDMNTPGDVLVELCAEEGLLPGDVISALCERAGCLDVLDEIRT